MSAKTTVQEKQSRRPTIAAIVVGAALSTLGAAPAEAAVQDVTRYCTACWRNARIQPDNWSDCTQEVLTRLVERVPAEGWNRLLARESQEHREFVRAIDAVKKRTQRARRAGSLVENLPDVREPQREALGEQRALVLQTAEERLSPRQATILAHSLDGWTVEEIARKLRVPPARISDEKYKAIRRLRAELS
jgi:RNA polymerase sigma factor (sigma-70 family)